MSYKMREDAMSRYEKPDRGHTPIGIGILGMGVVGTGVARVLFEKGEELAARIGRPKASRAVGAAVGQNLVSLIVPCHRVVGASGRLTGFGWGLEYKRWLLAHEGAILA